MSDKPMTVNRYTSVTAAIDMLVAKQIPLLNPASWDDENDRLFMEFYKEVCRCKSLYAFCAALSGETYHHWRIFTPAGEGACVEILREPLEEALEKLEQVRFKEVEYLTLTKVEKLSPNDAHRMPFLKRSGFRAEKEYRIIWEGSEEQAVVATIDMEIGWIHRIFLNPWMPDTIFNSVADGISRLPGCQNLTIEKSSLIRSPRWREAGENMVGREARESIQIRDEM